MNRARPEGELCLPSRHRAGAEVLVADCARVGVEEKCYVLADPETADVAQFVADACARRTPHVRNEVTEALGMHGATPPAHVRAGMQWADVIFCLTRMSLAHTAERQAANARGARYLSLPDYSLELLAGDSLRFDFGQAIRPAARLKSLLDRGDEVRIRTDLGTDLRLWTTGRQANACPGVCWDSGTLGSPPDAEVNIAPLEGQADGVVQVDGSIPCRDLGKLATPVTLAVRKGVIAAISGRGPEAGILEQVFAACGRPEARVLAEFGIGLNPLASLTGRMLEDEGCAGTIHLGFGSNATIGGRNHVPFHLDFVVREPTVWIGKEIILYRGKLTDSVRQCAA